MSTMHTNAERDSAYQTERFQASAGGSFSKQDAPAPQTPRPGRERLSWSQRFRNNWPVVPMRIFLGALFLFAGYAKFSYPGFFNDTSSQGLKQIIEGVKPGSPIGSSLQPIIDHASLFGHITAYAEFAIGAGLVVGLLTRIAALGGIALTTLIALSYNWGSIHEYTATYGWYTSVNIAVAVALTVFVLGGAGPLSFDRFFGYLRARTEAREDLEPSFTDSDSTESRRRLQADYPPAYADSQAYPPAYPAAAAYSAAYPPAYPATPAYPPVQAPPAPTYVPAPSSRADNPPAAQDHVAQDQSVPGQAEKTTVLPDLAATHVSGGYPAIGSDLEHDELGEVDPSPRGAVSGEQSDQNPPAEPPHHG